ncbi:MAG: hypothetical protein ACE5KF_09875, partial [Kiloniellaceae bacterium]
YGGQVGAGPEPGIDQAPEIDQAPGPRERLAAKLAKIHGRLAAAGADASPGQAPPDEPERGS